MLRLAVDMAAGNAAPIGHGQVYAPEHYIDPWLAVAEPQAPRRARPLDPRAQSL